MVELETRGSQPGRGAVIGPASRPWSWSTARIYGTRGAEVWPTLPEMLWCNGSESQNLILILLKPPEKSWVRLFWGRLEPP